MKIMVDLHGGPLDGSVSLEWEIKVGESYDYLEMAVWLLGVTSGFKYNVGHRFSYPSLGWLNRSVVRKKADPRIQESFDYEITQREGSPLRPGTARRRPAARFAAPARRRRWAA
jgi:hypothetical protein